MQAFQIAFCQCQSDLGTAGYDPRPSNLQRLHDFAKKAQQEEADLAIFGELYLTGYRTDQAMHRYVLQQNDDDPWVKRLKEIAVETNMWLLLGTASCGNTIPGDMYNSAFLISPQGLQGVYSKVHTASFVVDDDTFAAEGSFYSPGKEIEIFQTPFAKLGVQICYDVHFPEMSRVLILKGAEVIINLSAAVSGFEKFWDVLLPVRAEENRVWYVMNSVVGEQKDSRLFGGSRLTNPLGEQIARAKDNQEELLVCTSDADSLMKSRLSSHRLSARRPELYSVITEPNPYP